MAPRTAYPKERVIQTFQHTGTIDLLDRTHGEKKKRWVTLKEDGNHTLDEIPAWHDELNANSGNATRMQSENPAASLFRRQVPGTLPGGTAGPSSSKFTNNLSCPPGAGRSIEPPAMRLNCLNMPRRSYGTLGWVSESFCDNYFYSMGEGLITLTHDPNRNRAKARRELQCPRNHCSTLQAAARTQSNVPGLQLDCDEFPPASSEEGGEFHEFRDQTCVPSYQNNWHGQCVST